MDKSATGVWFVLQDELRTERPVTKKKNLDIVIC